MAIAQTSLPGERLIFPPSDPRLFASRFALDQKTGAYGGEFTVHHGFLGFSSGTSLA